MTQHTTHGTPADAPLRDILAEIAVPKAVLDEAKRRRDLILEIAMQHDAARDRYVSGSVAHGTHNRPLEDTDCGIKLNRRYEAFREFGPDAPGGGKGPEDFIQMFASFIEPRARQRYPDANVNLDGNRAIKFEFNETVEIDDWGPVDPYVDLIVGLSRADGDGLWIPNRRRSGWDAADPQHHTWLMTKRDAKPLRVLRARAIRLAKRAVKRDEIIPGRTAVLCSWNLSALALEIVDDPEQPIGEVLAGFFATASDSIARALTEDPSPVMTEPIKLPDGVSLEHAADRLSEMAEIVYRAITAHSPQGARAHLAALYGPEVEAIRNRERHELEQGFRNREVGQLAAPLGMPAQKVTRSHGV